MSTDRYLPGTTQKNPAHVPPGTRHVPQPTARDRKQERRDVANGTVEPERRQVWVGPNPGGHWERVS